MCLKTVRIVIGIFITLYLTKFCCCYIIPQSSGDLSKDMVLLAKGGERKVQICGATLSDFLQVLCRGNFNTMTSGGTSQDQKKLTEDCCRQSCKISVLAQFCEEPPVFLPTPAFVTRSSRQLPNDIQNHPSKLIRASASKRKNKSEVDSTRGKGFSSKKLEVRVDKKKSKNKKRDSSKRKRKTNNHIATNKKGKKVKMQCTYKSFGHYLLKRDPEVKVRYHSRKRKRNNTAMPLQVDTIPPNFENLGAMPEVVP